MALTTVSVSHYRSDCEEELPHKMGKKGANMLILDKDSSVESEQYTEEQDEMGQFEQGHSDDEAEVQENQDEVQEKQDDDD